MQNRELRKKKFRLSKHLKKGCNIMGDIMQSTDVDKLSLFILEMLR